MERPYVSIIIPVFNNLDGLERALSAVRAQTYPAASFEIIIVDNGSLTSPKHIAESYGARFCEERQYLHSPYSARNRGLEVAVGEVIVLLDTTCSPVAGWLEHGIAALQAGGDLVGGNVVFDVDDKSTLGEMYDSLINIKMKESVLKRRVAKTTNLFVKRKVFDDVGWFPEGLRSGGDVRWTAKAVRKGFKISFSEDAKAIMTTRRLGKLVSKQYRVSKGMPGIWKEQGTYIPNVIRKGVLCFLPPNPFQILYSINSNKTYFMRNRIVGLFFVGYMLRLVSGAGILVGSIK